MRGAPPAFARTLVFRRLVQLDGVAVGLVEQDVPPGRTGFDRVAKMRRPMPDVPSKGRTAL